MASEEGPIRRILSKRRTIIIDRPLVNRFWTNPEDGKLSPTGKPTEFPPIPTSAEFHERKHLFPTETLELDGKPIDPKVFGHESQPKILRAFKWRGYMVKVVSWLPVSIYSPLPVYPLPEERSILIQGNLYNDLRLRPDLLTAVLQHEIDEAELRLTGLTAIEAHKRIHAKEDPIKREEVLEYLAKRIEFMGEGE